MLKFYDGTILTFKEIDHINSYFEPHTENENSNIYYLKYKNDERIIANYQPPNYDNYYVGYLKLYTLKDNYFDVGPEMIAESSFGLNVKDQVTVFEIDNIFIKPKYRGNGIGTLMLQEFENMCIDLNVKHLCLDSKIRYFDGKNFVLSSLENINNGLIKKITKNPNTVDITKRFYEKNGFVVDTELKNKRNYVHSIPMIKSKFVYTKNKSDVLNDLNFKTSPTQQVIIKTHK